MVTQPKQHMAEPYSRVTTQNLDVMHTNLYDENTANNILEKLSTISFNSDEDSRVFIYGQWRYIPRRQTAFGDPGTSYQFSGNKVPALPWPEWMQPIREQLADWVETHIPEIFGELAHEDCKPNFVLVNYYRNGNDNIGFHSDDEKDLKRLRNHVTDNDETVILSLSFGATRSFVFQHKNAKSLKRQFELAHGDLCIMRGNTQKYWKHSIPRQLRVNTGRFNLTFRYMKK